MTMVNWKLNRLTSIIWRYTDTRENRILKTVNRMEGEAVHQFEAFKLVVSELIMHKIRIAQLFTTVMFSF